MGIYVTIEFFEKIDDVVRHGLNPYLALKYLFYSLPQIFFQILPVAFLIAALLALGLMSRSGELMAIKASGISLYRITSVLLTMAFLFSIFTFACYEIILPRSNQQAAYYKNIIEGKKVSQNLRQNRIWLWSEKNNMLNIQLMDQERQEARGIALFELDRRFQLVRRIDAQRGAYHEGNWYLYNGIERAFQRNNPMKVTFREFECEIFPIQERFEDIFALQKQPDEMNYRELSKYIERLKEVGYNVNTYLVDLHMKISVPFITFIMTLIGLPFAVKVDKSAKLFSVGLGLAISFIYWLIFYIGVSLGRTGLISPLIAVWLGNFIFTGLGGFLYLRMPT